MLTYSASDYSLNNPDTLTKYKDAATISQKVLEAVTGLCIAGEKIVTICEKGDKLLEEEIAKVYRGKNIVKGMLQRVVLPFVKLIKLEVSLTRPPFRHLPSSLHILHLPQTKPRLLSS
jgi:hypothetical protein